MQAADRRARSVILALVLVGALFCLPAAVYGFSKVGTTDGQFLKISVGRPTGMGDAFVGIADDPAAAFFNPAGLGHIGQRQVMLNHIAWIAGMNHEYLSGIMPIKGIGTVGVSVTALMTGDMEQTLIDNPSSPAREDLGTGILYSGSYIAVAASYARLITDKLAFGVSVRSINERIWDMAASGVAVDVGLLYNTGWNNLRIGAAVTNFGPDLSYSGRNLDFTDSTWKVNPPATYKTTPAPVPVTFRFGLGYDVFSANSSKLVAALDLVHPADVNETINLGLEYGYLGRYFLRAGYILNTDVAYAKDLGYAQGISAGAGIAVKPVSNLDLKLDYGYRNQGMMGHTHRLTLGVMF
jgi:hypothetical protein